MKSEEKKLEKLFVDEETISEEILYDLLEPYIRFSKKTNEIIPTDNFINLKNELKILITLIAIKALFMLNKRENDKVSPKELEKLTSLKGNTIRPILKRLYDQRIILKDAKGKYFVPPTSISIIRNLLKESS